LIAFRHPRLLKLRGLAQPGFGEKRFQLYFEFWFSHWSSLLKNNKHLHVHA
jgi:hypothetical protein